MDRIVKTTNIEYSMCLEQLALSYCWQVQNILIMFLNQVELQETLSGMQIKEEKEIYKGQTSADGSCPGLWRQFNGNFKIAPAKQQILQSKREDQV